MTKKCAHCGGENSMEAVKCSACGSASFFAPIQPPLNVSAIERRDRDHINLLSIFHFLLGFLCLCFVGLLLVHRYFMKFAFTQVQQQAAKHSTASSPPFPAEFMQLMNYFYILMGVILVTHFVLNILSGIFLRQKKYRVFSLVVGGFNCLQIPFGTILGVFSIVVLSRSSVRELYDKNTHP